MRLTSGAARAWRAAQARTRHGIREAVRAYTALRAAPGPYSDTVTATLRDGTPVRVEVALTIVPLHPQE